MSNTAGEIAKWAGVTIGGAVLLGIVTPWGAAIQNHQVVRSGHSGLLAWLDPFFTAILLVACVASIGILQDAADGTEHPIKRLFYLILGLLAGFFIVLNVQLLWLYLFTTQNFEHSWTGQLFYHGLVAVLGPPGGA
ncbi:hypothetical protein ACWFOS_07225 [Gordonia terrae]